MVVACLALLFGCAGNPVETITQVTLTTGAQGDCAANPPKAADTDSGNGRAGVPAAPNLALETFKLICAWKMDPVSLGFASNETIYLLQVLLKSTEDVGGLPNSLKGKEGETIFLYIKEEPPVVDQEKLTKFYVELKGDERSRSYWAKSKP
jgi:hypothetical protein